MDPNNIGRQQWRTYLRDALNWLRDEMSEFSQQVAAGEGEDLWELRDRYVYHLLSQEHNKPHKLDPLPIDVTKMPAAQRLNDVLELQRHTLMMFTSCGWFFDDAARVEPVQILRYARRAIELHEQLGGRSLEGGLMDRLSPIRCDDPELRDGRDLWLRRVITPSPHR